MVSARGTLHHGKRDDITGHMIYALATHHIAKEYGHIGGLGKVHYG